MTQKIEVKKTNKVLLGGPWQKLSNMTCYHIKVTCVTIDENGNDKEVHDEQWNIPVHNREEAVVPVEGSALYDRITKEYLEYLLTMGEITLGTTDKVAIHTHGYRCSTIVK